MTTSSRYLCATFVWVLLQTASAQAQKPKPTDSPAIAKLLDQSESLKAWALIRDNKPIEARELAERIVRKQPKDFIAQLVLGHVHHYQEANFPRALFHVRRALQSFEGKHGSTPDDAPHWLWHARILQELSAVHGELENYQRNLRIMMRYNSLYDPDMIAERAWTLMKMRAFDKARKAAQEGMASGDPSQVGIALNALCAVEFEAGNTLKSYHYCKQAIEHSRQQLGRLRVVDLTNFAEASRSVFKLDEAERVLHQATRASVSWYGNPWMDLGSLYVRQARFPEALAALKEINRYRASRPPHVQNSDHNEIQRVLAAFLLNVGEAKAAMEITRKAMVVPDRHGHNSRDAAQDRIVMALLNRQAHHNSAALLREEHCAHPWYTRIWVSLKANWLQFKGWMSGQQAEKDLINRKAIKGTLKIGSATSAIMPPWLVGDLSEVIGPGPLQVALQQARRDDKRPKAQAYYNAFAVTLAFAEGNDAAVLSRGKQALAELPPSETLLRGRIHALMAHTLFYDRHQPAQALTHYQRVFEVDPGVLRRLDLELPVQPLYAEGELNDDLADAFERSPRFATNAQGLQLRIRSGAQNSQSCLTMPDGSQLVCAETPRGKQSHDDWLYNAVADFHQQAFRPPLDLSQSDIHSLNSSNNVSRNPFQQQGP